MLKHTRSLNAWAKQLHIFFDRNWIFFGDKFCLVEDRGRWDDAVLVIGHHSRFLYNGCRYSLVFHTNDTVEKEALSGNWVVRNKA
jgi:hypothetical protein